MIRRTIETDIYGQRAKKSEMMIPEDLFVCFIRPIFNSYK